uniref:Uncharacterized protein n=1 Tax=Oryctolagus cuniculus TaxID=9986 RepID=A0A5F9DLP7_RABIT
MPVSFPFSSGMTLPTALAAPVEAGMMFWAAPRPSRHSFPEGPSTVFWVPVMACTVVMSASTMPKWSWMTLARGAKQLVVQDALLTILRELSPGLLHGGEDASGFHHVLGTSITPLDVGGISLLEDGDGLPVDDQLPVLSLDRAVELAAGGIILEHVDHVVEVNEWIVDGDNIHFARVKSSPGDQAPNAAKSVHSDLRHRVSGTRLHCTRSGCLSNGEEQRASFLNFNNFIFAVELYNFLIFLGY